MEHYNKIANKMTKQLLKAILAGTVNRQAFVEESTPTEWHMVRHIRLHEKTVRVYNNKGFDRTYTSDEWAQVKDQFPSFGGGPIRLTYVDKDGNPIYSKQSEPQ